MAQNSPSVNKHDSATGMFSKRQREMYIIVRTTFKEHRCHIIRHNLCQ